MKRLNLITFASVFQKKTAEAIREAHSELFAALDSRYEVRIIFEEEMESFLQESFLQETFSHDLTLIFIATGGTEGMVVRRYAELPHPLMILTDGKANSLAASLELGCWTRQQGDRYTILHGPMDFILSELSQLEQRQVMQGLRIGVIGEPSDWLVSSHVDYVQARERWGVEFVDVDLDRANRYYAEIGESPEIAAEATTFLTRAAACREPNRAEVVKALRLYHALHRIVDEERLDALTLQCFSLIPTTGTTGCLALSLLNDEGIAAGCEGDLPSIFTMLLAKRMTGEDAFMANPSFIDTERNEVLFAHCTIGLKQTERYIIRSHFESQSGVAIQGILPLGDVTVLKFGGSSLDEAFISDGLLLENEEDERKCRTQIRVLLLQPNAAKDYFLSNSISNHHIIIAGHHAAALRQMAEAGGIRIR